MLAEVVSETCLVGHTCTRFETFVAVQFRPEEGKITVSLLTGPYNGRGAATYFIEMPYCATCSKPDFHTSVTSQEFVACRRQERKADTALPPTAIRVLAYHGRRGERGSVRCSRRRESQVTGGCGGRSEKKTGVGDGARDSHVPDRILRRGVAGAMMCRRWPGLSGLG